METRHYIDEVNEYDITYNNCSKTVEILLSIITS